MNQTILDLQHRQPASRVLPDGGRGSVFHESGLFATNPTATSGEAYFLIFYFTVSKIQPGPTRRSRFPPPVLGYNRGPRFAHTPLE